jgi:outer membrane protein assembly factor BamB
MTKRRIVTLFTGLFAAVVATSFGHEPTTRPAPGGWPMWGGSPSRNAVSAETAIPHEWDVATNKNIKWVAPLGTQSYGSPVVADGRIYVATNNGGAFRAHSKGDKGCLLCFDEQTGKLLWQATHDKLPSGAVNDWPEQGVASNPYVDGDRVYYVSNRCELVCADAHGFYDGENDGPFTTEKHHEKQDADFVWILDMMGTLGVFPRNLAACSPVGAGDLIFVCTGTGINDEGDVPAPQAPSFIAVSKKTGKVVWQRNDPGQNILNGQWSSPAYSRVNGHPQVIFGGGDGWCYAFEPLTGEPIWKFNLNPKDAVQEGGGSRTKTAIVATPVVYDDKVFLAAGDDPEAGTGPGHLYAIDATKRGDITETGRIWHVGGEDFGRTISTVAIADGLLYAADLSGFLDCFDVKTGKRHWRHDMMAGVWGSPLVVDSKVMLGNTDGELHVLEHGTTLKPLATHDMRHSIYSTPVAANGVLYITTQRFLYAIAKPPVRASAHEWPMFRGDPQLTGVAQSTLPDELQVRWRYETPEAISSTAAIVDGVVYVGSDVGTLYALDLASGQLKWQHETGEMIESSPTVVDNLVVFGDDAGVLHACDAKTGAARWTFKTEGRIISSANCYGDRIVFGSYDGTLYCLRIADGKPIWKYETEERVHATPAIVGSHVLVAGCDAHLHVVNVGDGTPVRKVALDSVTGCSPAVCGSRVFLGTYGQQILGIDWQAGQVLWRFEDAERSFPFLSSAAVTGELVILGGRDKRLRALDPKTGEQRWQFVTKGQIDSSPVVVGQRVFVGSGDGNLYAVRLTTGEEVWRFEAGEGISASPAVADGCLVISTEDGVIYCFGSAAPQPCSGRAP